MLQFNIKQVAHNADIPISYIVPTSVKSHDAILFYDTSAFIPGNNVPTIGSITSRSSRDQGLYSLTTKSPFGNIHLTDEYFYDVQLKQERPLWYVHTIKNKIFNKSLEDSSYVTKNLIREVQLFDICSKEKNIIVNSEKIYADNKLLTSYYINYNAKTLKTKFVSLVRNLEIKYQTIIPNVEIKQKDKSAYIVYYEKFAENEYSINILTESDNSLEVTYFKKVDDKSIRITEITNPSTVFYEIPYTFILDVANKNKKVFSLKLENDDTSKIYVPNYKNDENLYKNFMFRQRDNVYTKLFLKRPPNLDYRNPWNVQLFGSGYKYYLNNKQFTFQPLELEGRDQIEEIVEEAEIVNKTIVKLNKTPLWQIDLTGDIAGIEVVELSSNTPVKIKDIDNKNKFLYLANEIGKNNILQVKYKSYKSAKYIANNLNSVLNPSSFNYYHVYYIIPNEYLKGKYNSIYIHKIPRYDGNLKLNYNIKHFLTYFELNKKFILEQNNLEQNLDIVDPATAEAFVLSIFYLETPVDEDYTVMYDSSVRGGGTLEEMEYSNDWSYWDGEAMDISGKLLYKIDYTIFEALKNNYYNWDEAVIRSSNRDLAARIAAENHINKSIEKHIRKGYTYMVEYVNEIK